MNTTKRLLVMKALRKYGIITPCSDAADFAGAFTQEMGLLLFWFNDRRGSTHIVKVEYGGSNE